MAADGSVTIQITGDDAEFKKTMNGLGKISDTARLGIGTGGATTSAALVAVGSKAVAVGAGVETSGEPE